MIDYNILSPDDFSVLTKRPLEKVLSENEIQKLEKIYYNYDYYSGKQHKDAMGRLVRGEDMDRPNGYDYDPAQFDTNYFKAFIKRKSRWQMAGDHGIEVIPDNEENQAEIDAAQEHEKLLHQLWKDNKMAAKKMSLARDRLIGGSVAVKLAYNNRNGKLHWVWHKAYEVFPIYSEDGFDEMLGADIIIPKDDPVNEGRTLYYVQHFRLNESDLCTIEEVVYTEEMKVKETLVPETSLGINFVPIVMFDVDSTNQDGEYFDDLKDMESLTNQLNDMMEDASDSLAFEMFGITVVRNAQEGTAEKLQVAPGAVVEINSRDEGISADMKTLENGFKWKEAYKDQYNRIKSALHELSGLPQIVPQELNFGGMNDRALQVLYQDIIQETQEHWLSWNEGFTELFDKSLGYLKARSHTPNFSYDKSLVNTATNRETRINFVLPLPDDREQLVELITKEVEGGFESHVGGMKRLGVVNTDKKIAEIEEDTARRRALEDPYNRTREVGGSPPGNTEPTSNKEPPTGG